MANMTTSKLSNNDKEVFRITNRYHNLTAGKKLQVLDHIVEWVQEQHVNIDREMNNLKAKFHEKD